ncbi:hypothetical protein B5J92_04070 [Moraxella atlantae]|nr:hypothetical protein B5J92_04070 [Moraxella atlantae]
MVDSAVNGTSLEEALKRSLRASIVDAGTGYVFTNAVKGLDSDALVDNIAHKLAAGLVGCASAELNKQSCEAGALGAAVGEMVGDYLVTGEVQDLINNDNLSIEEKDRILNTGKLTAASLALLLGYDVNTAANSAGTAIENNSLVAPQNTIEASFKQAILRGDVAELELLLDLQGVSLTVAERAMVQQAITAIQRVGANDAKILAERYGINWANKANHIFTSHSGPIGEALLKKFGSSEKAFAEIFKAVEKLNIKTAGQSEVTVNVSGIIAKVRVFNNNGKIVISTVLKF